MAGGEAGFAGLAPPALGTEVVFLPDDNSFVAPVPIVFEPGAGREASWECHVWASAIGGGAGEDDVGIVGGLVDGFGVDGGDVDDAVFGFDELFVGGLEVAEGLGEGAEALDGGDDVFGLGDEGVAKLGGPFDVFVHPANDFGVVGEGLDAVAPVLVFDLGEVAAVVEVADGDDEFDWMGGGGQEDGEERVGVEGDGAEEDVEVGIGEELDFGGGVRGGVLGAGRRGE